MKILPIASGKGGVGKSLIAANLSIALAEAGMKVVIVDLDLGASNMHMFLGIRSIKEGIGTCLNSNSNNFSDIILPTKYENLFFIPGDAEIPEIADLKSSQKSKLIKNLLEIETDFLILDLGAGTSYNVLDFFLISNNSILIATPMLTSIVNAYLLLKNAVFRIMSTSFARDSEATKLLTQLRKQGTPLQKVYIPKLLEMVKEKDPLSYEKFKNRISTFHPLLILNMLSDPKNSEKANQIRRSTREYLDLDMEHLGIIYKDTLQDVALNSRIPIIIYKPDSIISQAIYRIADRLMQMKNEAEGSPLDLQTLEESYQAAELAAENDYQTKVYYIEELLHCGELSKGDLLEIIKSQQFELEKLKKENMLIKSKIVKAINQGFET